MKKILAEGLDYSNSLREVSYRELVKYVDYFRKTRADDEILDLSMIKLVDKKDSKESIDLRGRDMSFIDFSWSDFINVDFTGTDFSNSILDNGKFTGSNFSECIFKDSSLYGSDLRACNLSNSDCDGTIFTSAILIDANLEGLKDSDRTVHFRMACPEKGYFFAYKKCFNDRMVKLLIPADAKRCSSTTNACRCDKAITVAIMNTDKSGFYTEASSFVDENFVYRLGEMAYADSYHEDRWLDSSHGIHFWMSFEEALGYM